VRSVTGSMVRRRQKWGVSTAIYFSAERGSTLISSVSGLSAAVDSSRSEYETPWFVAFGAPLGPLPGPLKFPLSELLDAPLGSRKISSCSFPKIWRALREDAVRLPNQSAFPGLDRQARTLHFHQAKWMVG
jgi:hypothetical protein